MSNQPDRSSLFVKNVPEGTRAEELKSLFSKYGPVVDVYIPMDYYSRRSRGFAYIQYEDSRDAEDALYYMDRVRFYGRELAIEVAHGQRKTPRQMRDRERGDTRSRRSSRSPHRRRRSGSRSRERQRRSSSSDHHKSRDRERRREASRSASTDCHKS